MATATLQYRVNAGALHTDSIEVSGGDVIALTAASFAGWGTPAARWEIVASPPGWSVPSGWSTDASSGFYYYLANSGGSGVVPPSITLPATSSKWGKWLFRLTVNGAIVSATIGVETLSPALGLHDLAVAEGAQFGLKRQWPGPHQTNLRTVDDAALVAGGFVSSVSSAGSPITIAPTTGDAVVSWAVASDLSLGSHKITSLATPTASTDAANKAYVDAVAQGLSIKPSVRAATTANITLSGAQTIDAVSVIAGDRVLVKNQSTASQNGLYLAAAGAWARTTDLAAGAHAAGTFVFAEEGTANGDTGWVCTTDAPTDVAGTDSLAFSQFTSTTVVAGAGLTLTGSTLDVVAADGTIVVNANSIQVGTVPGAQVTPSFGAQSISQTGATSITSGSAGFIGPTWDRGSAGALTVGGTNATSVAFSGLPLTGVLSVDNSGGSFTLGANSSSQTAGRSGTTWANAGAVSVAQTFIALGVTTAEIDGIAATKTTGRVLQNTTSSTSGVTVQLAPSDLWIGHARVSGADKTMRVRHTLVPKTSGALDSLWEYDTGSGSFSTAFYYTTASPGFFTGVVGSQYIASTGSGYIFDFNGSGLFEGGSSGLQLISYETADPMLLRSEVTGATDPIRVWASGETKGATKAIVCFGDGSTWAQHSRIAGDGVYEGPVLRNTAVKTANYTAALWDLVEYSTAGGTFTITLPSPSSSNKGQLIAIKNAGATDTAVTISTPSGAIDNAATYLLGGGWSEALLASDGGNGYLVIAETKAWVFTAVKTSAYTTKVGEAVLCDPTTGGFTVTLPSVPSVNTKRQIDIVVSNESTSTNTITIAAAGGQTVGGGASTTITTSHGSVSLLAIPGGTNWIIL